MTIRFKSPRRKVVESMYFRSGNYSFWECRLSCGHKVLTTRTSLVLQFASMAPAPKTAECPQCGMARKA